MSSMEHLDQLVDKIQQFLKEESEIYAPFSLAAGGLNIGQNSTSAAGAANLVTEPQTEEAPEQEESKNEKNTSITNMQSQLNACQSLEELRHICERSSELKTDLKGTNLVFGVGNPNANLMIIGEAPGDNEDKQGEPFVGRAGQLLNDILKAIQFERGDVYIANILKHRPPNNRDPKPEERQRSLPYLLKQIELISPKLILCVGRISATTLLGVDETLGNLRQKFHPFMDKYELMATYHPAALLRNPNWKRPCWEDVKLLRKRYDELVSD